MVTELILLTTVIAVIVLIFLYRKIWIENERLKMDIKDLKFAKQ